MATKKTKRTRFVPHAVLGTAFIGVIPACALAACGSTSSQGPAVDAGQDAGQFAVGQGVAVAAFFDSGQPDSPQFTVAVAAFFDAGTDTGSDAPTTDGSPDNEGGHDSGTG